MNEVVDVQELTEAMEAVIRTEPEYLQVASRLDVNEINDILTAMTAVIRTEDDYHEVVGRIGNPEDMDDLINTIQALVRLADDFQDTMSLLSGYDLDALIEKLTTIVKLSKQLPGSETK